APWELQALLKARATVGDGVLGARFGALVERVVWTEGLDVEALRSIRKLKEQVESTATASDIKRSRGGIRDVEFAIQLLQLVHGRLDRDLRVPATLDALEALHQHGFVSDEDRLRLGDAYRFLRDLEHRVQLWDLQQTHTVPDDPEQMERIARSMGMTADPVRHLADSIAEVKGVVRDVHERLYFRPILESLVGSPSARLGVDQAALRLEALGFQDVNAATRALGDLTEGLTRRSQAMHQVLPLMLDWLSLTPNPDLGLAQLRTVLARTRDHSNLVTLLQTNPLAGERLCRLLGTSRLLGNLIDRIPEFIPRLADDAKLDEIRSGSAEVGRLLPLLDSRPDPDDKIGTVRRFARRRKLRIAARDILEEPPVQDTLRALTESADATVIGGLHVAAAGVLDGFAVIAMGKWGGSELSYGSDLDLMYVFDEEPRRDEALGMAAELAVVLSQPSRHGDAYSLDAGLRPEGRKGPLARSLDSYRRYYEEWAEPWEMMALVKARAVAGDPGTGSQFLDVIEGRLWRARLPAAEARAIREIKARVEKERIPADEDPDYHLKLGPGAISDVEFLTQLLQLQHGGDVPELRVTGTLEALSVLGDAGILPSTEVRSLTEAYLFCTRIRLRLHLQAGRSVDSLPPDLDDLRRLASSLGYSRSAGLREDYRRLTRRSRRIFEGRFFE
ncbi:MAG: bifunctional [glutamine synthetase] adenylyltransferase/[glutamine synthetase]-adenylyl-L-tyrosine phosphorylase, partial [Acidimicrobiia bacterium]